MSLENALRAGILNSASVIQYLDTKTGLLTKEQLTKQLTQLDTNLIHRFPL